LLRIIDSTSTIRKIIILFIVMFILLLTPVVVQTYSAFRQARSYRDIIDNITYANQLNNDLNANIEPLVWNIVAGKLKFDESGVMEFIADIRTRMNVIKNNTYSAENRSIMDISTRALNTLESYLIRLRTQINEKYRVADNEELLEEIRVCAAGINDLLQEFSSRQLTEVSDLNVRMYSESFRGVIISILLIIAITLASAAAFIYIIRKSAEEQKQRQMLEYRLLQEQITPHFLYNTLDAIIWAAEAKDTDTVITIVTSLSSFFRTSLSQGFDFVPISDELEHVRSYLKIQQMRYGDILTYEIDADEVLYGKKVLKLLLQPLVENSLYHGVRNTRERGKITVSVKKSEGNSVRFSVEDDGIGMKNEELEELKQNVYGGSVEKGYGLFNVNRRLKLYYNLPGGIEIQSEYGKGTKVSFMLNI
jgi:two-component system sensor histidine kinase YesM